MYTWGYLKENTLNKLNLSEEEANRQSFLSRFPYFANEAMTQICSIKPRIKYVEFDIDTDDIGRVHQFPDDFITFSDAAAVYKSSMTQDEYIEVGDEYVEYYGHDEIVFMQAGHYRIAYKARWFFFTKEILDGEKITAPADICDAIPSYIASQCFKIDDEVRANVYRNEFEIFVARLDDTSFVRQRNFHVGGGW